ncbi:MAG TPA: metal-dependent hydrolase [Acidimicrobiales bacterium]|nr:metal-dependent hydrolase [Acidimicrobiales bacterium]
MTSAQTAKYPARDIPVRRLDPFPTEGLDRHFVGGDPLMSHAVAVLSAMFPSGEEFFVHSVRNYRDQVTDPELRQQANRFVGQESMHGRLHRDLNRHLAQLGFMSDLVDRSVDIGFNRVSAKLLPRSLQLAITAALEHYTATLAEVLLDDPRAQELFDHEGVRNLLLWHALEESEHKAVAFDVYNEVSGNTLLRRAAMDVMTGVFLGGLAIGTVFSTLSTTSLRDIPSLLGSLVRLPRSPFLSSAVLRRLRRYNHRDFHPNFYDATALLEHWQAELFGPEGTLTKR